MKYGEERILSSPRGGFARTLLILMAIGFLLAYPFKAHSGAAFLMHLCAAGLIGGLADWYGVVSLFRKPFGLPFERAIIPKNWEYLVDLAIHMVGNEFLTEENIYKGVKRKAPIAILTKYLQSPKGEALLGALMDSLLRPVLEAKPWETVGEDLLGTLRQELKMYKATPYGILFLRRLYEPGYCRPLWEATHKALCDFVESEAFRNHLSTLLEESLETYAENSILRTLLVNLGGIIYSTNDLAYKVQNRIVLYMADQGLLESPLGQKFQGLWRTLGDRLETDPAWQQFLESKKEALIDTYLQPDQLVGLWQKAFAPAGDRQDSMYTYWFDLIVAKAKGFIDELSENRHKQALYERLLLMLIRDRIPSLRLRAMDLTREKISNQSLEVLVPLLEYEVWDDLQMIRINGTLIGAFLGGLFFGLTLLMKGVLGL